MFMHSCLNETEVMQATFAMVSLCHMNGGAKLRVAR
jgi:hypothetical protein